MVAWDRLLAAPCDGLVLAAAGEDTLYSDLFDIGWPNAAVRTLKNSTTQRWEEAGRPSAPHRPGEGETVARRGEQAIPRYHFSAPTPETSGEIDAMALYCGEAVGLVRASGPAAAIVNELAAGF